MFKKIKDLLHKARIAYCEVFMYPRYDLSQTGGIDYDEYWKDKRGTSLGRLSGWQRDRANIVCRMIPKDEPVSLLDIGCGDGGILQYLKEKLLVTSAVGMDTSAAALEKAASFGIKTVQAGIEDVARIESIPAPDYSILFEVLEHTPNSEEALLSVYNRSKKGVFFSFPNSGYFIYRLRLLFGRFPMQWRVYPGEHVRYWTKKDLEWWLAALHFKTHRIFFYRGIPVLNALWPSMFARGFVVYVYK